ncbi:hypothetical protein ABIB34_003746 [Rhodococcus sp. UYP5]
MHQKICRVGTRKAALIAGLCLAVFAASSCSSGATESEPESEPAVTATDLDATIKEAYSFAFPLYDLSRYRWTALETTDSRTSTTLNNFVHSRSLAGPDDTWANGPSQDVLYSTAWLNLADGPVYLDIPEVQSRYYSLVLIDFYSNSFFYAGERTTGTQAQKHLVVGPDWQGEAPADATVVRAPTNDVYVNLRVQTTGTADQVAANAVQDGFRFTPTQPVSESSTKRVQPTDDDPENYLDVVNQMLELNPPPAHDQSAVDRFREVGICGADCGWGPLPDDIKAAWNAKYPEFGRYMQEFANRPSQGWTNYNPPGSVLGTTEQRDYTRRAFALSAGGGMLGMDRKEANYWITFTDADNAPLLGTEGYVLRLPEGGIPAEAFWSVTLYEVRENGQYPSPNPIDRYVISSETEGLISNPDGSIDLHIQPTAPSAEAAANWLPSPADGKKFILFARSYIPGADVLAGTFTMPPVVPAT